MPNYHLWTIGCQMNRAESERLGSYLEGLGYRPAAADAADLVIVNSCVVRQSAENRVTGKLDALRVLKARNPNLVIAVTGCLVNSDVGSLRRAFPHVDHFLGAGDCPPWLESEGWAQALPQKPPPGTYVSIMQGCDNFCSYCIVPYRRGRERSRPIAEVVCEVRELVRRGAKEVTLLGQNVDSYGRNLPGRPELADLLAELNSVDGLARMRFLTSHPKDMSPRLIEAVATLDKVCELISLPVQSGSNEILDAMRRGYTAGRYRELVGEIRDRIPGVALSTDVIVGFPGESPAQFQQTFDLLSELEFDTVHAACYSPRAGTLAAKNLEDNVPRPEKKERLQAVEQLQEGIAAKINARLLGTTVEVLVEGTKGGKWQGRTRSGKLVFMSDVHDLSGKLVPVRIKKTSPWSLQGEVLATDIG